VTGILPESDPFGNLNAMTKELASESARKVASYLKTSHGATRVVLFGSALKGDFRPGHSDIDLYFEGIPYDREMAVAGMTFCAFPELELDLIPAGHATRDMTHEVELAGVSL
jgi:tRNA nucleotidyltransferase (CCA-adding enzyme)